MAKVWITEKPAQDSIDIVPETLIVKSGCCATREQLENLFPQLSNLAQVGIPGITLALPDDACALPVWADGDGLLIRIESPDGIKSVIPVTQCESEPFSIPIRKAAAH